MSSKDSKPKAVSVQDPDEFRDERGGAYDPMNEAGTPVRDDKIREDATSHQQAQTGADVRRDPVVGPALQDPIPEGLRRERQGACGPTTGVKPKKQD